MKELIQGILKQYLLKLKGGSAMAWAVLVSVVGLLISLFSGTLGVELPPNWTATINTWSVYALPILLTIQEVIKQIKNEALASVVSEAPTTRGLMAEEESETITKAKKAYQA